MKKTMLASLLSLASFGVFAHDDIVNNFHALNDTTPGCAAGVVKAGNLVYEGFFGQANLRYQVPVDDKTVFNVASISKHMTAALVFILEDAGKLSRGDTLDKYYPDGPAWFADITLYQMLTHQSGLPGLSRDRKLRQALVSALQADADTVLGLMGGTPISKQFLVEQILAHLDTLDKPSFIPGTNYRYGNTGHLLLADIIEQVSGQSFEALADEKLFAPLGMKDTGFPLDNGIDIPWSATGYESLDDGKDTYAPRTPGMVINGASGLRTTLADFAKWVNHLMDPAQDQALWNRFMQAEDPVFGRAPDVRSYQYVNGLLYQHRTEGSLYSHTGFSYDKQSSSFWFEPAKQVGYFQLCNFSFFNEPSKLALVSATWDGASAQ